jgi:hypothetical protein
VASWLQQPFSQALWKTPDRIGPCEGEFFAAVSRYARWMRSAVIIVCGVIGILAVAPGEELTTVALVGGAMGWYFLGFRAHMAAWFAAGDVVIVVVVGLSQVWTGIPPFASFPFVLASITAVTVHFEWPAKPAVAWSLAGLSIVAFLVGQVLAGPETDVLGLSVRLVVPSVLARVGFVLVRASARVVDRLGDRVAARRREVSIARARRAAEKDYLAMLHDTASTTMLMVSTGAPGRDLTWLPDRARQDMAALLTAPRATAGEFDLVSLLTPLRDEHEVRLELDTARSLALPASPALAIVLGVREALRNVEQHAGDADTTVSASVQDDGTVVVEVRDTGCGFRPADVPIHRRGLAGSVVGRMAAAGGVATVLSAPGAGTTVRWTFRED